MPFIVILILAVLHCSIAGYLTVNPDYYQLGPDSWESEDFRAMRLGETFAEMEHLEGDLAASLMLEYDYDLRGLEKGTLPKGEKPENVKPKDYRKLRKAYERIFQDLKYFPVPSSTDDKKPDIAYQDSWGEGRTYKSGGEKSKGEFGCDEYEKKSLEIKYQEKKYQEKKSHKIEPRKHEGCDLMGEELPPGSYPVVSMTDGVAEQVGWLELGGWRIGIRAPGGAYFYYAHLYRYEGDLKKGDKIRAGQLIGYMGDTGYGLEEGTRGKFPCHLHVGMYLRDSQGQEMSVNPYWLLRWLEKKRLVFSY